MGCCLVVFQFLDFSMHLDTFDRKLDHLFVIERAAEKNGARLNYTGVIIKQGDNVFRENIAFVDDAFYQMFDYRHIDRFCFYP